MKHNSNPNGINVLFFMWLFRKSYERQIKDLKEDLDLERQTIADYLKHKARMTDLLAQLQAQIEVLSAVSLGSFEFTCSVSYILLHPLLPLIDNKFLFSSFSLSQTQSFQETIRRFSSNSKYVLPLLKLVIHVWQ